MRNLRRLVLKSAGIPCALLFADRAALDVAPSLREVHPVGGPLVLKVRDLSDNEREIRVHMSDGFRQSNGLETRGFVNWIDETLSDTW